MGSTADAARERIILEHQARRPDWSCGRCGEPWPCLPYRQNIVDDALPTQLAIMMTAHMTEAAGQLLGLAPGELWDRFVAWTRRH